jgi:hypothetical protein
LAGSSWYTAILDANVLYPQLLRDTLLSLAVERLCRDNRVALYVLHGGNRPTLVRGVDERFDRIQVGHGADGYF